MEDLGTLGGRSSRARGISQTGQVVGESETAAGRQEAFLWTRARGMRSLGTLGGESSDAWAVNTHRRVVGTSLTTRDRLQLGFLWTPERGMQRLPAFGANNSTSGINEFGEIAGSGIDSLANFHAILWRPIEGPLVMGAAEEMAVTESATPQDGSGKALSPLCASRERLADRSGFLIVAGRACLEH
jgi:probable HAF family extracellular repeat protein